MAHKDVEDLSRPVSPLTCRLLMCGVEPGPLRRCVLGGYYKTISPTALFCGVHHHFRLTVSSSIRSPIRYYVRSSSPATVLCLRCSMASNDTWAEVRNCLNQSPARRPRACVHCHIRKVRCNAWQVGIPCTRCKRRNQADTCLLALSSHGGVPR